MTEASPASAPIGLGTLEGPSAGAMLRAAREKRGLHIAALAASMKVTQRKLESLEADRYDELPDLTFTRALAQAICRALKIDAEPVLAKLPQSRDMPRLARLGDGINARFREAPGRRDSSEFSLLRKPMFWATLLVLVAALALALLPERWMPWRAAPPAARVSSPGLPASAAAEGASSAGAGLPAAVGVAASAVAAAASAVIETVHSVPPELLAAPGTATPGGPLQLRTSAASWIEVQDARGSVLLSRSVQPGETVGLDGALPLRLTIGNAAATQIVFRGAPVDLAASTRDNVARLQLP